MAKSMIEDAFSEILGGGGEAETPLRAPAAARSRRGRTKPYAVAGETATVSAATQARMGVTKFTAMLKQKYGLTTKQAEHVIATLKLKGGRRSDAFLSIANKQGNTWQYRVTNKASEKEIRHLVAVEKVGKRASAATELKVSAKAAGRRANIKKQAEMRKLAGTPAKGAVRPRLAPGGKAVVPKATGAYAELKGWWKGKPTGPGGKGILAAARRHPTVAKTVGFVGLSMLMQYVISEWQKFQQLPQQAELARSQMRAQAAGQPSAEDQIATQMLQQETQRGDVAYQQAMQAQAASPPSPLDMMGGGGGGDTEPMISYRTPID